MVRRSLCEFGRLYHDDRAIACDISPVLPLKAEGVVSCAVAVPDPNLYKNNQKQLLGSNPGSDNGNLFNFIKGYFSPNLSSYYENVRFGSRILQGFGGRIELLQTPLGSVEFEAAYAARPQPQLPEGTIGAKELKSGLRIQISGN